MVRELYQRLREYFNNLPEPTEEERQFIRELNAGYFPITSVHRDDLEGQGFDVEKISDDDMQNLAEKMADDYCEQLFWPSMEIIAGEILSFPKVKTKDIICPKCNSENIRYDIHESRFHCGECSLAWDDKLYALVEFPEESAPTHVDFDTASGKSDFFDTGHMEIISAYISPCYLTEIFP